MASCAVIVKHVLGMILTLSNATTTIHRPLLLRCAGNNRIRCSLGPNLLRINLRSACSTSRPAGKCAAAGAVSSRTCTLCLVDPTYLQLAAAL